MPNSLGYKKDGPTYRFIAIRERIKQLAIPGVEQSEQQLNLPFATIDFSNNPCTYKLFSIVTNYSEEEKEGDDVIWWNRKRCGKSEGAHTEIKHDMAGGRLPSGKFGANAAGWAIMILALNLNAIMRRQILPPGWENKRMKAIRYAFINLPGRVMGEVRELTIRIIDDHPFTHLLMDAREKIYRFAYGNSVAGVP